MQATEQTTEMATDEQGYNGWKNYETWAAHLWITNDQGSYYAARELTEEALAEEDAKADAGEMAAPRSAVADALSGWIEELVIDPLAKGVSGYNVGGLAVDLLRGAFGSIDWFEVADAMIEDVTE